MSTNEKDTAGAGEGLSRASSAVLWSPFIIGLIFILVSIFDGATNRQSWRDSEFAREMVIGVEITLCYFALASWLAIIYIAIAFAFKRQWRSFGLAILNLFLSLIFVCATCFGAFGDFAIMHSY